MSVPLVLLASFVPFSLPANSLQIVTLFHLVRPPFWRSGKTLSVTALRALVLAFKRPVKLCPSDTDSDATFESIVPGVHPDVQTEKKPPDKLHSTFLIVKVAVAKQQKIAYLDDSIFIILQQQL
jgi:hypothetical protein